VRTASIQFDRVVPQREGCVNVCRETERIGAVVMAAAVVAIPTRETDRG
jgi:hypothetical protein